MYRQRNTEARSRNHCFQVKVINVKYSVYVCMCVFVTLVTQHGMRMRYIVNYGQPSSTIFSYIIS